MFIYTWYNHGQLYTSTDSIVFLCDITINSQNNIHHDNLSPEEITSISALVFGRTGADKYNNVLPITIAELMADGQIPYNDNVMGLQRCLQNSCTHLDLSHVSHTMWIISALSLYQRIQMIKT